MKIVQIKLVFVLAAVAMIWGCSTSQKPMPAFEPVKFRAQGYSPKNANMVIVIDTSSSMGEDHRQHTKFDLAKSVVSNMAETIPPELDLATTLRSFGHDPRFTKEATTAIIEMDALDSGGLVAAVSKMKFPGGPSPIGKAIDAVELDLIEHTGKSALIIITDGKNMGTEPVTASMALKEKFGETLCLYPILVGNDPKGKELVEDLAQIGGCGFPVNADDLASGQQVADYVRAVFIGNDLDMDGDGVPDSLDRCAGTTLDVDIDEYGCPIDSDGDGIADALDFCDGTPPRVKVDYTGCPQLSTGQCRALWAFNEIVFDVGTANITPTARKQLDDMAAVMDANPKLDFIVEGHTDDMGSRAENMDLSQTRAQTVVGYLVSKGISSLRLTAKGYGATQPVADNHTWLGRSKNRRVQFTKVE